MGKQEGSTERDSGHQRPHFHVRRGEHRWSVDIESGKVLAGERCGPLPQPVAEWAQQHRAELFENWHRARRSEPLARIEGE